MHNFIKKIVEGSHILPNKSCLTAFQHNFSDAVYTEWYEKNGMFEAIFYQHNLEHIATFNPEGELLEYRQNLPIEFLPGHVRYKAGEEGEIMNALLINKGNLLEYEIIVRNGELVRHVLKISEVGEVKEVRQL